MIDESQRLYEFDEFRLDVRKRQLTRHGEVVPLYPKAFDLLLVMLQNSGRDLSKNDLLEAVWPGQMLEEANLTVNMSAVRKALGERATQPRYIINIPGRGYRFVADLHVAEAQSLLIQTETVSQITIEEQTDDQDAFAAASKADSLPASTQPVTQADRNNQTRRFFQRPALLLASALFLIAAISASIYLWRSIRVRAAAAGFRQIKLRQLTNDGGVVTAALSPDSRFFAVVQVEKTIGRQSLRLVQTNGEAPIDLIPPASVIYRQVEFAPDGNNVYYVSSDHGQNSLYRLPVLGGVPVKIGENFGSYFAISADGRLAYSRGDGQGKSRSIIVSGLDGSNERTVFTIPANRNLNPLCLSWSPDASMFALSASPEDNQTASAVFVLNIASGTLRQLGGLWREVTRVAWLKDGSGVLTVAAPTGAENDRQIWLLGYPNGEVRQVTNDLNNYDNVLNVSSNSVNVLTTEHDQVNNVWLAPTNDFQKIKQLTFGASRRGDGLFGLDWTPDGRIVYTSAIGKSQTVWIMNADGSGAKQLTAPGSADMTPSVSGDGRFVVFDSDRNGGREIWRINIDGANLTQLTSCGKNSQPSTSPDGKWVVYTSDCEVTGALWRVSIDGGQAQRLTDYPTSWPWVSPDSKSIACEYLVAPGVNKLAIVSIDGGPPLKVFDVPQTANFRFGVKWSSDGKTITYRDWVAGVWRQSIDGGAPQRVEGLPEEKIYANAWSRDGKFFAFTRGVEIRDVVLISNSQ